MSADSRLSEYLHFSSGHGPQPLRAGFSSPRANSIPPAFTTLLLAQSLLRTMALRISSAEYPLPAPRPAFSISCLIQTSGFGLADWRSQLRLVYESKCIVPLQAPPLIAVYKRKSSDRLRAPHPRSKCNGGIFRRGAHIILDLASCRPSGKSQKATSSSRARRIR